MTEEIEQTKYQISDSELAQLKAYESIIEHGLKTFTEVGSALMDIRDKRLYRADYETFEDYCHERWSMSRFYAHRIIEAASITTNLLPIGNIIPRTESQARPLASLEPDEQREVWQRVITSVPETEITAARVQKAVDEYKQKPHVSYNSGNNEWYTPAEYIHAARDVMGSIDLDPASSELANKTVNADTYYTAEDDGLTKEWFGHVWMNPPYSSDLIGKFADKLTSHYQNGDLEEAIVLVNNATETNWFQTLLENCLAVCFLKHRVKFIDTEGNPSGAPLQGQAILYFGNQPAHFGERFKEFGVILYHDC